MTDVPVRFLGITLSPLSIRAALLAAGSDPIAFKDAEEIPASNALLLWTADWLAKRGPVSADQQRLIIEVFAKQIMEAAVDALDDAIVPAVLGISDGVFAFILNSSGWLDLRTGEMIYDMPKMPIESYAVNLTALYHMQMARVNKKG